MAQQWKISIPTARSPLGLGRFDHDELIRHAGVINADGVPTVAGMLALGHYPRSSFLTMSSKRQLSLAPMMSLAPWHVMS